MSSRNIKARKKLSELFRRGVEVRFDESGGHIGPFTDQDGRPIPSTEDQVVMWVQAPSPIQREMALRDAQASRSKALLRAKREQDSEEYLTSMAFIAEMSHSTLLEYVLGIDEGERQNEAMREVLSRDEWSDFTSYQDAFRRFEEEGGDPESDEWRDLFDADRRYGEQVAERLSTLNDAALEALKLMSREELERKALDRRSEIAGSQAFMAEYERQMLYYAVRDFDNRDMLFFDSVTEWNEQPEEVQSVIIEALGQFIEEATEAKNSQGAASGSSSSTPPSEPEISEASTPKDATE